MTVEAANKRENIYHLRELRDRIAGEIFARIVIARNDRDEFTQPRDIDDAIHAADRFVRHLAANPFTLESK